MSSHSASCVTAASVSACGRVDERVIASARATQDYRVRVLVPQQPAKAGGYPVLTMLDGDALLPELLAHFAHENADSDPILVVLISHVAQGEAARQARVYDYTPGLADNLRPPDPRVPAWRNGGADEFLGFLESSVMPWVNGRYATDTTQITFYGHSYAALCVLHALCTQAIPCARYMAVSPSVWWQNGAVFDALARAALHPRQPAEALILAGSRESWHPHAVGADGTPASRVGGQPTLPQARELARALARLSDISVAFQAIDGGTHHTMLAQSVAPALAFARRVGPLVDSSFQEQFPS